jgi:hypothetical protein
MDVEPIRMMQETIPLMIQNNVQQIINITAARGREQDQAETPSLPPIPSLPDFMERARQSFIEDAAYAELELEPVVTWERLSRVVVSWVKDNMPPNEGARVSLVIMGLLESIYEDRENAPSQLSVADARRVVELLLMTGEEQTDLDVLKQVLHIAAPEYTAGVMESL